MTKRQLIDEILTINRSARPHFLAQFSGEDLGQYLAHLRRLRSPRLTGDPHRYDKYFTRRWRWVDTKWAGEDDPAEPQPAQASADVPEVDGAAEEPPQPVAVASGGADLSQEPADAPAEADQNAWLF